MKVIVTGATGFIGKSLIDALSKSGYHVIVFSRHKRSSREVLPKNVMLEYWDAKTPGAWVSVVDGAHAVINLTGEPIAAKRWTPEQKERIINSRVDSTKVLANAISSVSNRPKIFLNASAVGYYGNVASGDVTESSGPGAGFLADTCVAWENAAKDLQAFGLRLIYLRIGIVLEKSGGALAKMIPPFKAFIGGPLGSGRQWFPWIHRDDIVGSILHCLKTDSITGPVNLTAPESHTMGSFSHALGKAMHRPSFAPVPAFVLKLLLGEMSEMLLGGQKAVPQKLLQTGYLFKHPKLDEALASIFA